MNTPRTCPDCGSPLPADAPQGLCPQCLAQAAMKTQSPTASPPSPDQTLTIDLSAVVEVSPTIRYFGDYELIQEIARGGMGVVYKARQKSLNRIVAVKMILSGQLAGEVEVKRFRTEAEAAANLQHPNIVAIHEVGEHEGRHYFSMDYVEGKNLADHCAGKPLSANQVAGLVKTIAEAVQYAHQRGILHRDLKPQNVLLDERGQPRITDFGLAKNIEQEGSLTVTGAVLGSPNYMAPEQAAGKQGEVGPASDVYALGAILYHLLTGRAPFVGETPVATMMKVIAEDPAPPRKQNPSLPADLETVCLKCLEKRPEKRYATARALMEDLQRFLNGEPVLAKPASPWRKAWHWLRRRPWLLVIFLSVGLVLLLGTVFWLQTENDLLRFTSAHPEYVKNSGPKTKAIEAIMKSFSAWLVLGVFVVPGIALLVLALERWLLKTRRATGWIRRPEFALLCVWLTGAVSCIHGIWVLQRGVQAHIWESASLLSAFGPALFMFYIGLFFLIVGWDLYRRGELGFPSQSPEIFYAGWAELLRGDFRGFWKKALPPARPGSETSAWDDYAQTFRPRRLGIVNALALAALAYWTGNVLGKDSGNHVIGAFLLQTGVGFAANGVFWAVKSGKVSLGQAIGAVSFFQLCPVMITLVIVQKIGSLDGALILQPILGMLLGSLAALLLFRWSEKGG